MSKNALGIFCIRMRLFFENIMVKIKSDSEVKIVSNRQQLQLHIKLVGLFSQT